MEVHWNKESGQIAIEKFRQLTLKNVSEIVGRMDDLLSSQFSVTSSVFDA